MKIDVEYDSIFIVFNLKPATVTPTDSPTTAPTNPTQIPTAPSSVPSVEPTGQAKIIYC